MWITEGVSSSCKVTNEVEAITEINILVSFCSGADYAQERPMVEASA